MASRHQPPADLAPASPDAKLVASFHDDPLPAPKTCDTCGKPIDGEPGGSGLFVWTRGDEVRYEEPPLCTECAKAIGLVAMSAWEIDEEEGGD